MGVWFLGAGIPDKTRKFAAVSGAFYATSPIVDFVSRYFTVAWA